MKKISIIAGLMLVFGFTSVAQTPEVITKNFIELTGTSETEITPDEIYLTITLQERMEGKEKITIEKQEESLRQILKDLNIDLKDLTLNSADANYGKVRRSTKDVLIQKSYVLKTTGTEMLAKVYERLDKMDAHDAYVSRYTHSKLLELQKENRIKAIKAAKEKTDYVLAALGQQAGKVLEIRENENYVQTTNPAIRNLASNAVQSYNSDSFLNEDSPEISFKKIKIRASFFVKYEILNK